LISSELSLTKEQLELKESQLRKLEQELNLKKQTLDELEQELKEKEKRILELESMLVRRDSTLNDLKKKISSALFDYEDKGLNVIMKDGKIYVSLEESLMFPSGSWAVDKRGEEALSRLAKVLEANPDISIIVEGHTDDVPYRGRGEVKDNWDLSVMRATAVVKILLQKGNINPSRITAAGRGEYAPIDPAKTAEARQKNRRTEIILTPKIDELIEILKTD
jgi:chemotaxis protein MotB